MPDNRKSPRYRKRLRVVFSDGTQDHVGFTSNLSRMGVSISAAFVFNPGTKLTGRVGLPTGHDVRFEAEVRWSRKMRGSFAQQIQNSMGLRYASSPGPFYDDFLDQVAKGVFGAVNVDPEDGQGPRVAQPSAPPGQRVSRPGIKAMPGRPEEDGPVRATARVASRYPVRARSPMVASSGRQEGSSAPPLALIPGVIVGLEGKAQTIVTPDDLAAPGDIYSCSVSPHRAALWVEQAAIRALAPHLPSGIITVGLSTHVLISHVPATAIGSKIATTARLVDISPVGRTLTFEFAAEDGVRSIATGKHVRALLEPRRPGER